MKGSIKFQNNYERQLWTATAVGAGASAADAMVLQFRARGGGDSAAGGEVVGYAVLDGSGDMVYDPSYYTSGLFWCPMLAEGTARRLEQGAISDETVTGPFTVVKMTRVSVFGGEA